MPMLSAPLAIVIEATLNVAGLITDDRIYFLPGVTAGESSSSSFLSNNFRVPR